MTSSIRVILNPTAGGGACGRRRSELERDLERLGLDYSVVATEGRGHAVELADQAAREGAALVVAAGGDGTIHEVANGILRARDADGVAPPTLGIFAVGTGNDFAKLIDGARDPRRAIEILAEGIDRRFDVGRVSWEGGGEYFINGMGTGVDTETVRQVERLPWLPGTLRYLVGVIRALIGFRPISLWIEMDDDRLEAEVLIMAIGNGECLGGGFYICPGAVPDDAEFDVCIAEKMSYPAIGRALTRVLRGTHAGLPKVLLRRATSIRIEARGDDPLFFHLDGELREPERARWIRVEVDPGAIPVRVSAPAAPEGAQA